MAIKAAATLLGEDSTNAPIESLADRRTPELVIGLVGPVGSGVTTTATILKEILTEKFGYAAGSTYKVSDVIKSSAGLIGETYDESLQGTARINRLQTIGNKLREKFGGEYLAEKIIEQIGVDRFRRDGYRKQSSDGQPLIPKPRRHFHIVDSIKHPEEVQVLRDVYGDSFWLFGVFAPQKVRKDRLISEQAKEASLEEIFARDEAEEQEFGQKVRDTIYLADFFIRNDGGNDVRLRQVVDRYLEILFGVGVHTPTQDEVAMYTAVSAAARSACLSRQVGAAIYSREGELIGVGANDVPRYKGGLYATEDDKNDNRCYKWGGKICHNDDRKEKLYQRITTVLIENKLIDRKVKLDVMREALSRSDIKNLIEYSRAVHAEMEAIISVARSKKGGTVGATMYCTTFPCHSCARHIVASGIDRVVYIEPYPKSLAVDLHRDAISVSDADAGKKVVFLQYDGVAPKNVIRFFKSNAVRKEKSKLKVISAKTANPLFQPPMDGFATHEQLIVNKIKQREEKISAETRPKQGGGAQDGKP